MLLYARTATIRSDRALDAIAFATEISGVVTTVTGVEVHAWSALYGAPLNSVAWTCNVDSHAEMGALGEKLQADAGYTAKTASAYELFEGAPEDHLSEVIATVNDSGQLGNYASVVTAQCAAGKIAEAMAWGVDIFNHVGKVTGRDGILSRSLYGGWAAMTWISIADTLQQVDEANAAMNSDPGYIEMVDQGGSLFLPGSATSMLTQRLA